MWPTWYHILDPMTEESRGPRGIKILWNNVMYDTFKEFKFMVSDETLLSYLDWKNPLTVHTDASDKQLGAVISRNKNLLNFSQGY